MYLDLKSKNIPVTKDNLINQSLFFSGGTLDFKSPEIDNFLNLVTLKDKINSYKSYSNKVKAEVLKQLDNVGGLNDEELKNVLKRLPKVLKYTYNKQVKFNKIEKTVYRLEKHAYAPELNTLHFKDGSSKNVGGATTIEEAIKMLI